jgi:hypothetical protein
MNVYSSRWLLTSAHFLIYTPLPYCVLDSQITILIIPFGDMRRSVCIFDTLLLFCLCPRHDDILNLCM